MSRLQTTRYVMTILLLLVAVTTAASAEIGPYVGASVGQSRVELALRDVGDAGFRIDDEDFAYKIYLGLELPGPLAVEGGYRDLGRVTDDGGLIAATAESDGFDAFLLGKLPLGPIAIFAKGGVIAWDTEVRTTAADRLGLPDIRVTDDGTDFAWGVGLSFEIGRVSLRGEFEKFEIDIPEDVSMLSVGVAYEF